jgi:hypothetical protein
MRFLSYCLTKRHRKFTSAYLLCDIASLSFKFFRNLFEKKTKYSEFRKKKMENHESPSSFSGILNILKQRQDNDYNEPSGSSRRACVRRALPYTKRRRVTFDPSKRCTAWCYCWRSEPRTYGGVILASCQHWWACWSWNSGRFWSCWPWRCAERCQWYSGVPKALHAPHQYTLVLRWSKWNMSYMCSAATYDAILGILVY